MNYHDMIEPYLYGSLSPEDEVAFEKQLTRDPALAEATELRLNAREALAGIRGVPLQQQSSSARTLLFFSVAVVLIGLFWWKMRPSDDYRATHPASTQPSIEQSKILPE